jgi:hypothetical protein
MYFHIYVQVRKGILLFRRRGQLSHIKIRYIWEEMLLVMPPPLHFQLLTNFTY